MAEDFFAGLAAALGLVGVFFTTVFLTDFLGDGFLAGAAFLAGALVNFLGEGFFVTDLVVEVFLVAEACFGADFLTGVFLAEVDFFLEEGVGVFLAMIQ